MRRTEEEIKKTFDVKVQNLDPDDVGAEMIILNRRVVVEREGYAYEPDGKHTNKVLRELGLDAAGTKGSQVTGAKVMADEEDLKGRTLDTSRSSWFRSVAATLNYMSLDRPDLGFAVKEICRCMSSPSELDVQKLKKVGRYLVEYGNTRSVFGWHSDLKSVIGFSDSDFAGGEKRTSTSGGVIVFGDVVIKCLVETAKSCSAVVR